jgi:serine/threonine-protein kinase
MPVATPVKIDPAAHKAGSYSEGDIIASKYRLTRLIAEGGMGTVWVARNMTLHADVALKLIRREIAGSDEAAQRLLNEARATAQLDHPSIVKIHDFGATEQDDPFIVMELLKGESLCDVLEREGRLDATQAVQLLLPIVDALRVAHETDVVHRDIKPDNVLLVVSQTGDVVPKLIDFGVAKLKHRTVEIDDEESTDRDIDRQVRRFARGLTRIGSLIGSPNYMAPEQARGDTSIDGRADLWALCVVLYEAVSDARPFEDDNLEQLLMSVLIDEPAPVDVFVGEALWSIIRKGLSKDRDARWQTAAELGVALAEWLLSQGVEADATGRSLRRKWLRTGGVTLSALDQLERSDVPAPSSRRSSEVDLTSDVPPGRRLHWAVVAAVVAVVVTVAAAILVADPEARQPEVSAGELTPMPEADSQPSKPAEPEATATATATASTTQAEAKPAAPRTVGVPTPAPRWPAAKPPAPSKPAPNKPAPAPKPSGALPMPGADDF